MKVLAISVLLVNVTLGWSVRARAQDAGVEPPPPAEEEKPDREPPTAGALPFEDPTIAPPRDQDLEVEEPEAPDRPTAAGPVEDPTQHGPRETEPGEEPETAEGPAPEKDEGPNVKVVYD